MLRGEINSAATKNNPYEYDPQGSVNGFKVEDYMDADEPMVGQEKENIGVNLKKRHLKDDGLVFENIEQDAVVGQKTSGGNQGLNKEFEPDGLKLKKKKGDYVAVGQKNKDKIDIRLEKNKADDDDGGGGSDDEPKGWVIGKWTEDDDPEDYFDDFKLGISSPIVLPPFSFIPGSPRAIVCDDDSDESEYADGEDYVLPDYLYQRFLRLSSADATTDE